MEFINLDEVLQGMATCFQVNESSEYAREKKISAVAGRLHQLLNNYPDSRPRWVEIHKISRRPIFNDATVHPEGMALLEHTAGWFDREWNNHVNHIAAQNALAQHGKDPSLLIKSHRIEDGKYPRKQFLRAFSIGFEQLELVTFLNRNKVQHALLQLAPTEASLPTESAAQRRMRRWQMCIDAGLEMPQDTFAHLPPGIRKIAESEGITRQALAQDLNKHRDHLFGK